MKKIVLRLTGLKFLASVFGFFYSILQVRLFGASEDVDNFFVAVTGLYMINSLTQAGQLAEVFLPEYLRIKGERGSADAHLFFSVIMTWVVIGASLLLFFLFLLAPLVISILAPGISSGAQAMATEMFKVSLPMVLMTMFSSLVNTTLNAEQIYGRVELTGLISSIVSVILIVLFDQVGIWILIYALFAGKVIEAFTAFWFMKRMGLKYHVSIKMPGYNLLGFFRVLLTTSGYVGATQIYTWAITALTTFLPEGTLSIFNYAKQLATKASVILIGPMSTVFFSKFANLVKNVDEGFSLLVNCTRAMFAISFLLLSWFCIFGRELLQILWSEETLSALEFRLAYGMIFMNLLGLIFSSTGSIFRKAAIALGGGKKLYERWIVVQFLSAVFAFGAIKWFGVWGLACMLAVNMLLMAAASYHVACLWGIRCKRVLKEALLGTWIIASVVMMAGIVCFSFFLDSFVKLDFLTKIGVKSILFVVVGGLCFVKLTSIRTHDIRAIFKLV